MRSMWLYILYNPAQQYKYDANDVIIMNKICFTFANAAQMGAAQPNDLILVVEVLNFLHVDSSLVLYVVSTSVWQKACIENTALIVQF